MLQTANKPPAGDDVRPTRISMLLVAMSAFLAVSAPDTVKTASPCSPPPALRYTRSAATHGRGNFTVAAMAQYGIDPGFVSGVNGSAYVRRLSNNSPVDPGVAQMVTAQGGAAVGLGPWVDLDLSLPFYVDIADWGEGRRTMGNPEIAATFVPSLPIVSKGFSLGVRMAIGAPLGNSDDALFPREVHTIVHDPDALRPSGMTTAGDKFYFSPTLLASMRRALFGTLPFELRFNGGCTFADAKEQLAMEAALAFVFSPAGRLVLSIEGTAEKRFFVPGRSAAQAFTADPFRLVPSAKVSLGRAFDLLIFGEAAFADGSKEARLDWHRCGYAFSTKSAPLWGAGVALVYHGGAGRRTVATVAALPAQEAASQDGDRDGDGISDRIDRCPDSSEDRDGSGDEDGCPDPDNDNDGIVDTDDGCPGNPEDIDGFEDKDGCPDFDNDGDGLADSADGCPVDSGPESNHGCPSDGELSFVRTTLGEVAFEPGTSRIVSGTDLLDRIARAMLAIPVASIEFQVHTDNVGSSKSSSALSQNRANVLKLYLVSKGIRPDRITALGLGSEFPIDDNSTEGGRARNNRVELRRTQ